MSKSKLLKVEVADTPSSLARGLMFRKHLDFDRGMLFKFKHPQVLNFWGMNTYIPLDIAFINNDNIIEKIGLIEPFSEKSVSSSSKCIKALEVNAGFFKDFGISIGDKIEIEYDVSSKNASIDFNKKNRKISQLEDNFYNILKNNNQDLDEDMIDDSDDNEDIVEDNIREVNLQGDDLPEIYEEDLYKYLTDDIDVDLTDETIVDIDEDFEKNNYNLSELIDKSLPQNYEANNNVGKVLKIWYKTKSGINIERIVEPHGSFYAKTTGNSILLVYDRTVGGIRSYIISSILWADALEDEFIKKFKLSSRDNIPNVKLRLIEK